MKRLFFAKAESGFSAVEMISILGIAAVLAGIAVPAYLAWLPNFRLKGAARNLYSDLRRTRLDAVKHNLPRRIVFNTGVTPGTYTIMSPGNDGAWGGGDDVSLKTVNLADYGFGVDYGSGSAPGPIGGSFDDMVTFSGNMATFNSRGFLNPPSGYVYLHHRRQTTAYAVGALTSGAVRLRKSSDGKGWTD
jgi:type IV fimbrial biogenesis protein FimT